VNWVNYVWIDYFWASLKGNGPEALVQTVVYGAVAALFIPAVRRFEKRLHAKLDLVHAKLDHVIEHHPDIPPFDPSAPVGRVEA